MHMQHQQQFAGAAAAGQTNLANKPTQPIVSLSPFLGSGWAIKARVTDKSVLRDWTSNKSGEMKTGQLFSCTLLDESGAIRATFFGDDLPALHSRLTNNECFVFANGTIKAANKRYSSVQNDYEVTFDRNSAISDRVDTPADIPTTRYSLCPLEALPHRQSDTLVDVLVTVKHTSDFLTSAKKDGTGTNTKKLVTLVDKTAICQLDLWNDAANACSWSKGDTIIIKGARINQYKGNTSLTMFRLESKDWDKIPAGMPELVQLGEQASAAAEHPEHLKNISRSVDGMGEGGRGPTVRQFFGEVTAGTTEKPNWFDVRCIPVFIKTDSLWYESCIACNKKLQRGPAGNLEPCKNPQCTLLGQDPQMKERYTCAIQCSDGVDQQWISLYDKSGEQFFGMSAHELKQLSNQDTNAINKHCLKLLYKPMLFGCKAVNETYEGNTRMKITSYRVHKLEQEDHFRSEIAEMTEYIEQY